MEVSQARARGYRHGRAGRQSALDLMARASDQTGGESAELFVQAKERGKARRNVVLVLTPRRLLVFDEATSNLAEAFDRQQLETWQVDVGKVVGRFRNAPYARRRTNVLGCVGAP